jgi:hypothetical protein
MNENMTFSIIYWQHLQTAGIPRQVHSTTFIWKHLKGTRLIAEPNGKKL